MNSVVNAVAQALDLMPASATLVVGYSGGLDSTVLLHAVNAWRIQRAFEMRPQLTAVHVHHGLSKHADRWLDHAIATCSTWNVPLHSERVEVSTDNNLEAAARAARYAVFIQALRLPEDRLLLAHHADDQVETLLMRVFSGRGVLGMPGQRELGEGQLLRPLLSLTRAKLAQYARTQGLNWIADESNRQQHFDRNWLRYRLLPTLAQRWPNLNARLTTLMDEQNQMQRLLMRWVDDRVTLTTEDLGDASAGATLLRLWLARRGEYSVPRKSLVEFARQVLLSGDGQPQLRLQDGTLWCFREQVHYVPHAPSLAPSYELPCPGEVSLPHGRLSCGPTNHPSSPGRTSWSVRFRQPGDRLVSRGDSGGSRRLKDVFREQGIPPWLRDGYPLLVSGQQVLCVPRLVTTDGTTRQGVSGASMVPWTITWEPS